MLPFTNTAVDDGNVPTIIDTDGTKSVCKSLKTKFSLKV